MLNVTIMNYSFDTFINRENTYSVKYDLRKYLFGKDDVIPMWVADMDFKTPPFIIEAIKKRLEHEVFGYTFRGDSFSESVAGWMKKRHDWPMQKEWVCFSPGIVPALNMAVETFTSPGDKIIVQKPVYFPFFPAIENHGRILVNNPLKPEGNRFGMDFENLLSQIDEKVKMIMFCSPHNPTGNVWRKDELERLTKICLENDILILSDEIHSDLIYKGHKHIPTASLSSEISDRTITCIAPSKTFNLAGLSTSVVIISNNALRKKYEKKLDDIHVGGGNIFGFVALEAAYKYGEEWLEELLAYLQGNLDFLVRYLKENIPSIKLFIPEATYLVWLDCRELGLTDIQLNEFMVHEAGLGLSDGTLFGKEGSGFQRINIGCPLSTLQKALEQLKIAVVRRFGK